MKKSFVLLLLLMLVLCACTAAITEESALPDETSKEQISNTLSNIHTQSVDNASSEDDVIALPSDGPDTESEDASSVESLPQMEVKTVLIDPGHGFGDVGCTFPGTTVYEKQVVMTLSRKIGEQLQNYGINVLYTHDGASFPTGTELIELDSSMEFDHDDFLYELIKECCGGTETKAKEIFDNFVSGLNQNHLYGGYERCYYANLLDAEQEISLLLSVHINTNTDSDKLRGFELYYCSDMRFAEQTMDAMQSIKTVLNERFSDRNTAMIAYTWDDGNIVNKYVDMPSILIESGFATTPSDAQDLQNEQWQNEFARAIADGIVQYLYG